MAQGLLYYRHIAIIGFFFNILCLNVQNTSFFKASKVNRASRLFIALLKIISHLKKRRSGCFEQRSYPSHPINRFRICCKFFLNAKKKMIHFLHTLLLLLNNLFWRFIIYMFEDTNYDLQKWIKNAF